MENRSFEEERAWWLAYSRRVVRTPYMLFLLFVCSGLFVGKGVVPAVELLQSRDWVPTSCKVSRSFATKGAKNRVVVDYSYQVGEQTYDGDLVFFGYEDHGVIHSPVKPIFRRVGAGSETILPCFVNPRNPRESVLFREISSLGFIVPLVLALVFFLAPLAAQRLARR